MLSARCYHSACVHNNSTVFTFCGEGTLHKPSTSVERFSLNAEARGWEYVAIRSALWAVQMKVTALVPSCKNSIVVLSSWVPKIFVFKVEKRGTVEVYSVATAPEGIEWNVHGANQY